MSHAQPPRSSRTGSNPSDPDDASGAASDELRLTRVQGSRGATGIGRAMWLLAAFVVLAVLKPWGGGGPIAATLRPDVAVPVEITPVPTADRTDVGLALEACLGTGAWRVATLETWRNRDVRVWRAIEPATTATGPLDPSIPAVPVVADVLHGLGWCAPAYGPQQPIGPARVRAWQVVNGAARSITLRQVQPEDGITPIAALYLPASGAWTTGLVVFQYTDVGSGSSGWFAADLEILGAAPTPALEQPASPGTSAGASPGPRSPASTAGT